MNWIHVGRRSTRGPLVTALATLNLAGTLASAQGLLSHSVGIGATATNWSGTLELPGFDPALGTLTEVDLSVALDVWQTLTVGNLGPAPASFDASSRVTLDLAGPVLPLSIPIVFSQSGSLPGYDGSRGDANPSAVSFSREFACLPNIISVPASQFDDFEAGGVEFPAIVAASNTLQADSGAFLGNDATSAAVASSVPYSYVPIPEPEWFALFAGACAAFAIGAIRRLGP